MATDPIPMTEEQKFVFDLKGFIAIPGALTQDEVKGVRDHILTLRDNRDSLDPKDRYSLSGPAQILLDHPTIVGVLREVLGGDRNEDCYGFRCENSFHMIRSAGQGGLEPHGGGLGVGVHAYNCKNQRIYSGLTRVVWELNDVNEGDGGTLFMPGSHKMNFRIPDEHNKFGSPLYESYVCPAGSVIIFSESVCHAGPVWNNTDHPRIAVFNCYSNSDAQYHKLSLPTEVIEAMPPKRRTLFRGVWHHDFYKAQPNNYFSADNVAL
ncbi:MAG: phytanoyl-CoA dioxygenase family protein [Candidatus Poribacteria bacterium]|nr:phytanoyl-CoA dioxygenase family protein [Candidatus Poribacteria bacterium]